MTSGELHRNEGVNEAERYLTSLCRRTFLSLWSYVGLYRDQGASAQGEGKEVVDLLVAFENDVLLFSDKACAFQADQPTEVAWSRWHNRAVLKSAKQLWGAERWLRRHPTRLFLDRACTQRFPLALPESATMRVHRIAVTHGISEYSRAHFGGTGSLMLTPAIGASPDLPFNVGDLDGGRGYVHVLDDTTLEVLMGALDTISDFVAYLRAKEELVRSGRLVAAAGDDDLLAYYLGQVGQEHRHTFGLPPDVDGIVIEEGHWEGFQQSDEWAAKKHADEISYMWDMLIEKFNYHLITGTQEFASAPGIEAQEPGFRLLAREPRVRRRMLARSFGELLQRTPSTELGARVIKPSADGDPHYVFVVVPTSWGDSDKTYREKRHAVLLTYCRVARLIMPDATVVVGIATESGTGGKRSEDFLYYDGTDWAEEERQEALRMHRAGILNRTKRFSQRELEYPTAGPEPIRRNPAELAKPGRNQPCPCGSGAKYKKCCGRGMG